MMRAMEQTGAEISTGPGAIEADVPCERCGYNLRGLTPPGLCPECGHDVERSCATWRRRTQALPPPDAEWVACLRGGAWLSLAAFVFMMFAVLIVNRDPEWYRLRYRNMPIGETPVRVALLAILCAWWVFGWAAAWRTMERERLLAVGRVWARIGTAGRLLMTAHLLMPFIWGLANLREPARRSDEAWHYLYWAAMYCGVGGMLAATVCLGRAIRRLGGWGGRVEAWLLGVAIAGGTAFLHLGGMQSRGSTSLSMMFHLPAYPYGPPVIYEILSDLLPHGLGHPVILFIVGVILWSLSFPVRLLLCRSQGESG
jgi:hypothetical protein